MFCLTGESDSDSADSDWDESPALSEDDADIWNSFSRCDDPYNPLNLLTVTTCSTPQGIPRSSSAPELSPEVTGFENEEIWRKDTPAFSPPKPEALMRVAKKVNILLSNQAIVFILISETDFYTGRVKSKY